MNNPHVEALYYRFISENPNDDFNAAQEVSVKLGNFEVTLRNDELIAKPTEHIPDEKSAIEALEPYLHAWEDRAFLEHSHFRIRFIYKRANIIDLNPNPNSLEISLGTLELSATAEVISIHRSMDTYPDPPTNFSSSQLMNELIYRLKSFKDGREQIPTVAYAILDRLESTFSEGNRRKQLAEWLHFDEIVLENLGNFSNKRDQQIGRHMGPDNQPITALEKVWIEQVAFRIVQRVGEINAHAATTLHIIRMSDFPPL